MIDRTRVNIRLENGVWRQIDLQRTDRAGFVSRNTWIEEAVIEKLAREAIEVSGREKVSDAPFS